MVGSRRRDGTLFTVPYRYGTDGRFSLAYLSNCSILARGGIEQCCSTKNWSLSHKRLQSSRDSAVNESTRARSSGGTGDGVRGIHLEVRQLGGRIVTSLDAIDRFSAAVAEAGRSNPPTPAPRNPKPVKSIKAREAAKARAREELKAAGY